jgi:DNA-binding response OmpR family regulator
MSPEKVHILLVEDDKSLASVIRDYMALSGYRITMCEDGMTALDAFRKNKIDICILDVMLPRMDGYALAEEIRKTDEAVPILFLTSKSEKEDRIKGFKTGGDDFITKPFNIEELVLRMEVFLKRSRSNHGTLKVFQFGSTAFDYSNFQLIINKPVSLPAKKRTAEAKQTVKRKLTEKEAGVLLALCSNMHKVVKRDELLMKVWGSDDYFLGRSLDVFISKLRKYLSADPSIEIENHHGVGFKLTVKT